MKKLISALVSIIVLTSYLIGGGLIGYFTAIQLNFAEPYCMLLFAMVFYIISLYLNLILHESGHMIFGSLTGYKIMSIRFGNTIFLKNAEGKFIKKKYSLPGTGGQCLMMPKESKDKNHYPFILYNAGGGLMNIITAAVGFLLCNNFSNPYLKSFFFALSVFAVIFALTNLIPLPGTINDGKNIMCFIKNKHNSRFYFYNSLLNYAEIAAGKPFDELTAEYYEVDEANLTDAHAYNTAVNKLIYYIYLHDFENAKNLAKTLTELSEGINPIVEIIPKAESLFLELIGDMNEDKIKAIYSKKLKKAFKSYAFTPSMNRIGYAYETLFTNDEKAAKKYLKAFEKAVKNYPFDNEIECEQGLIKLIDEIKNGEAD